MSRAGKSVALFAASALALLLAWHVAARPLTAWAVRAALRAWGLPAVAFEVGAVSWGRLQLYEIRLPSGDLSADRLTLGWGWSGLADRRLATARIEGLTLRLRLDADGDPGGELGRWLRNGGGSGALPPVDRIVARDVRVEVATPEGPAEATGGIEIALRPRVEADARVDWRGPGATEATLRIGLAPDGGVRAAVDGALDRVLLDAAGLDAATWPERLAVSLEAESAVAETPAQGPLEVAIAIDVASVGSDATRGLRLRGPARLHWRPQPDGAADEIAVTLPECADLALPAGLAISTFAIDAPAALCVRTADGEPIRVSLTGERGVAARLEIRSGELALRAGDSDARHYRAMAPILSLGLASDATGIGGALQLETGAFELADQGVSLHGLRLEGDWRLEDGPSIDGTFRIGRVVDGAGAIPELAASGRFDASAHGIRIDGDARDAAGELQAKVRGAHTPSSGAGRAELRIAPVGFGAERRRIAALSRWWPARLSLEGGALAAVVRLGWGGPGFAAEADVDADALTLALPGVRIERLDADLALDRLAPVSTRGAQTLRFDGADVGIPIGAGRMRFALGSDRVLSIEEAGFALAGGRIDVTGSLDLRGGPAQRLELEIVDVGIPELLELAPVDGLEASGRLRGRVLLEVEDGRPVLRGGVIRAVENGRIRYRPEGSSPADPEDTDLASAVRTIMRDFHYELLDLSVEGWLDERADVQMKIRGHNPSFQDGHPVHLTLNLSTAFAEVVDAVPELRGWLQRLGEREGASDDAKRLH